jgi:Ca-activated chloride channel family protein
MINYFDYGYPAPATRDVPFQVSTESRRRRGTPATSCCRSASRVFQVAKSEIPASNLVFLIDTSGSMQDPDKLPLLKQAFAALVEQLRPQDRITMVAYAGSAGLVLPPDVRRRQGDHPRSARALDGRGSTNGGQGLQLAYDMARRAFIAGGVNRVLLATDGDFNVGTFDQKALETMIGDQRKSGIALTTLGFGTGNYNDQMAERLADLGDGNHSYDRLDQRGAQGAVEELSSTMLTIAQDVKIQVEFNPAVVAEYRLIGYENRPCAARISTTTRSMPARSAPATMSPRCTRSRSWARAATASIPCATAAAPRAPPAARTPRSRCCACATSSRAASTAG